MNETVVASPSLLRVKSLIAVIVHLVRGVQSVGVLVPFLALLGVSVVGVGLVLCRIVWTHQLHYAFLVWNLFLAWLPLVFAVMASWRFQRAQRFDAGLVILSAAWLLFFPNAPYIFTDVIHLFYGRGGHFWVDLSLILTCAFTGLVLGFVSLYLMQALVRRRFGVVAGWLFTAGVAGLGGFGIYLGRVLRFNSWDVIINPLKLCEGVVNWAVNPLASATTFAFPALFATFFFLAYVMLYALTHLPRDASTVNVR